MELHPLHLASQRHLVERDVWSGALPSFLRVSVFHLELLPFEGRLVPFPIHQLEHGEVFCLYSSDCVGGFRVRLLLIFIFEEGALLFQMVLPIFLLEDAEEVVAEVGGVEVDVVLVAGVGPLDELDFPHLGHLEEGSRHKLIKGLQVHGEQFLEVRHDPFRDGEVRELREHEEHHLYAPGALLEHSDVKGVVVVEVRIQKVQQGDPLVVHNIIVCG
mmetsp:Transcript_3110/g.2985  ORF Transcript_3110/g.2985 Transcript_3110/m.2985 type:complete len:216 (-) Transcript_3110:712-1359(-)